MRRAAWILAASSLAALPAAAILFALILGAGGLGGLWFAYVLPSTAIVPSVAAAGALLAAVAVPLGRGSGDGAAVVAAAAALAVWAAIFGIAVATGSSVPFHDRYAARYRRDLAAGRARRAADARANRRALAAVPLPPGARLVRTEVADSALSDSAEQASRLYEAYVNARATLAEYDLVFSRGWTTYRTYLLRAPSAPSRLVRTYRARLRAWTFGPGELPEGSGGPRQIFFWRDGRCVWFHFGVPTPPLPPARTLDVATARSTLEFCR